MTLFTRVDLSLGSFIWAVEHDEVVHPAKYGIDPSLLSIAETSFHS